MPEEAEEAEEEYGPDSDFEDEDAGDLAAAESHRPSLLGGLPPIDLFQPIRRTTSTPPLHVAAATPAASYTYAEQPHASRPSVLSAPELLGVHELIEGDRPLQVAR